MKTSVNTLSGMPGDTIEYHMGEGPKSGVISRAGWQPAPNGGKVWTYETVDGDFVPNEKVTSIVKGQQSSVTPIEDFLASNATARERENLLQRQRFMESLNGLDVPPIIKTVIHCLAMNTTRDLEVAHHLLTTRLHQVYELELINNPQNSGNNT